MRWTLLCLLSALPLQLVQAAQPLTSLASLCPTRYVRSM
jgi:hypothetical protein